MEPYYQEDGITIYHGDFYDVLNELEKDIDIDLVLTDPPYGIKKDHGKIGGDNLGQSKNYGNYDWDNKPIHQTKIDYLKLISNKMIMFGGNYYSMTPSPCWLVWDKVNTGNFADCELAWTNLDKAVRKFTWKWNGMLQQDMKRKEFRYHPTQKPVELMKWCIEISDTTGLIVDPFMGSGTTLIAARQLGREVIGIDIEKDYCDIAIHRLGKMDICF